MRRTRFAVQCLGEKLEERFALAADLVFDSSAQVGDVKQIAMVGTDLYFSTGIGSDVQIRRFQPGTVFLATASEHRVALSFRGEATTNFMLEVGNRLMYGIALPYVDENAVDARFQIWSVSSDSDAKEVWDVPAFNSYGFHETPSYAFSTNDRLFVAHLGSYRLLDSDGSSRSTFRAPFDINCMNPMYVPAIDDAGVAIEAAYGCSEARSILVRVEGNSFRPTDYHPSSLLMPNGVLVGPGFTTDPVDLVFVDAEGSAPIRIGDEPLSPRSLTRLGRDFVFFSADGPLGREPWVTDGTREGTQLLRDINRSGASNPEVLGQTPHGVIFSAASDTSGSELWTTDGTVEGTKLLKRIRSDAESSQARRLAKRQGLRTVTDLVYFWADGERANELWATDGTVDGTGKISDPILGGNAAVTATAEWQNGSTLFGFTDAFGNSQVWSSNGTPSQTKRLATFPAEGDVMQIATSRQNSTNAAVQLAAGRVWLVNSEAETDIMGDASGDGLVNFEDFLILAADFGSTEPSQADFDDDGRVTFADFLILSRHYSANVDAAHEAAFAAMVAE